MDKNKPSHTPGPYVIKRATYIKPLEIYVMSDKAINVCTVWAEDENGKKLPMAANARLFAAAPDLLEACKALLALESSPDAPTGQLEFLEALQAVSDKARAAVEKAEGCK